MKSENFYNFKPGMLDSHFHGLHMDAKGIDSVKLIRDLFSKGMHAALEVGINTRDFSLRLKRFDDLPELCFSAGIHPAEAGADDVPSMLDTLEVQLSHSKVSALGETGLDFYKDYAPKDKQRELFHTHIDLAKETGLPLIIHSRSADDEVLASLMNAQLSSGGIMHCYGSDLEHAYKFIDLGFKISFAGNFTYPKAEDLRETARKIPIDSILLETDAPYLAPQAVRGHHNHPGLIGHSYDFLAELRSVDIIELIMSIRENYDSLFV